MDKKILIVDDDVVVREELCEIFQKQGWVVTDAMDGLEAWRILKDSPPHVVIADINMPEMDGLELLEHASQTGIEIPFILVTGLRDLEKMERAWKDGVFELIDKPFDEE